MALTFAVTFDYRCPFAWHVHDHVLTALEGGADWNVTFVPLSQSQLHVEPGELSVWDDPGRDSGLHALQVGTAARDHFADRFPDVHRALFEARHRHGRRIDQPAVVAEVLTELGIDVSDLMAHVDDGTALATVRAEHEQAIEVHDVWGVPTFILGDDAAFVRLMHGAGDDPTASRLTIERLLALIGGWPDLNELKHTRRTR